MICEQALRGGRLVQLLVEARLPVGELYAVYPSRRFQAMKVKTFLYFLMSNLPVDEGRLLEPAAPGLVTSPP
jgi:DNA-binding transcriptional LysR family regulator